MFLCQIANSSGKRRRSLLCVLVQIPISKVLTKATFLRMRCSLNVGTETTPGAQVDLVSHWSDQLEHLGRAHDSNSNTSFTDVTQVRQFYYYKYLFCPVKQKKEHFNEMWLEFGPKHEPSYRDNRPMSKQITSRTQAENSLGLLINSFVKFDPNSSTLEGSGWCLATSLFFLSAASTYGIFHLSRNTGSKVAACSTMMASFPVLKSI